MNTLSEIKFEKVVGQDGYLGIITLTRQQALNALNHVMFQALYEQLTAWNQTDSVKAVVVRAAEGRAFCAGGDIRYAYERKMANDGLLHEFFRDEYQLNSLIHHFSKPYIALLDGMTMGGGAGISLHGSHKIATKNLIFSMPETGIGFYPDVGATYFLSRCPFYSGIYLGLTGARIHAEDCAAIGLVDFIVNSDDLINIITEIKNASLQDNNSVTHILKQFALPCSSSSLVDHQDEIEACFSKKTVEEILQALKDYDTEWCQNTAEIIQTKSPTSLKVTLRALQIATTKDFDACMQMEYQLTQQFLNQHDFFEGIRAAIIDKDQSPCWRPMKLSEVSELEVDSYFL